jgi:hypothetical protein
MTDEFNPIEYLKRCLLTTSSVGFSREMNKTGKYKIVTFRVEYGQEGKESIKELESSEYVVLDGEKVIFSGNSKLKIKKLEVLVKNAINELSDEGFNVVFEK